jgi:hypothetical protein
MMENGKRSARRQLSPKELLDMSNNSSYLR